MEERQTSPEQSTEQQNTSTNNEATTKPQLSSDELQSRLQQLEQESSSYKDQYLRTAADLKNFKRRTEEERGTLIRNATAGLIMKILPILDDFDLAMQHVPAEVAETSWFNGLQGMQRKLQMVLEGEGVKPIEALGEPFNPHFHDAVMHEDAGPEQAGKVTADLRRGYMLHDRVLRPSMVKVGQE
ncbi:MAG: nucleotide exchange factor GrpE [Chloroflexi bacterium]|nr:nucleotide exchange factor GrpE [Chloroflexota bacterium]